MRAIALPGTGSLASVVAAVTVAFLLPTTITAETVIIHNIQEAQEQFVQKEHATGSPFLSATLKTEIHSVPTFINSSRRKLLSDTLVTFLRHVFDEQQAYDVDIVGVSIFEEELVENERRLFTSAKNIVNDQPKSNHDRLLVLNALQAGQFVFEGEEIDDVVNNDDGTDDGTDDDEAIIGEENTPDPVVNTLDEVGNIVEENDGGYDDEIEPDEVESFFEDESDESENVEQKKKSDGYTLIFAAVVSAEHTQQQSLTHGDFQAILIHICHKFNSHLVEFVNGIDDNYFSNVTSLVVSGYEAQDNVGTTPQQAESKLSAASIVAIVLCVLGFVSFAFLAVKKLRRRGLRLKINNLRLQDLGTNNANNSIKSSKVLYTRPPEDDYSFDPLSSDNGYNGYAIPRFNTNHAMQSNEDLSRRDESLSFENQSTYRSSPLFRDSLMEKLNTPTKQYETEYQHVFAPPGKVGVAIDVVNGNPTVHKIKRGSPLEGLLKPKDLVIAIDDVDTTSMSAADVTHLMVKRMNYQRKITFLRKES